MNDPEPIEVFKIEALPAFVANSDIPEPFFLTLNRDRYGKWTLGYMNFDSGECVPGLYVNSADTIDEASTRMWIKLQMFMKRNQGGPPWHEPDKPRI